MGDMGCSLAACGAGVKYTIAILCAKPPRYPEASSKAGAVRAILTKII